MVVRKAIFLLTALVLTVFGYGAWRYAALVPPVRTAEIYIRALASGNTETAEGYAAGSAAFAASRLKNSTVTAQVVSISCSTTALGRGWARILAVVELTLQDGTADVGWYGLDVAKTGQNWKVVSFQEVEPVLSGTALFISRADAEAARQVFEAYMGTMSSGDWQEAAKHLTGTARRNQEASAAALGKGAVIGKVKGLHIEPVWERGKEMVVKFGYTVDGRDVSVLAAFYKTGQGWKITRVLQI
jgi:hypothetical protein